MRLLIAAGVCFLFSGCAIEVPPEPSERPAEQPVPATPVSSAPVSAEEETPSVAPRRPAKPGPVFDWGGKLLLAHYMPWYTTPEGRGRWGRHWTGMKRQHNPEARGADGLPDIWSHYNPLIGLYDSADPDAIECHLLQMKLAGIDGVIADWYGLGKTDDYPEIHEATLALFDAANAFGMKFAACFEDRTVKLLIQRGKLREDGVPAFMRTTMEWMRDEWFAKPHYLHYQGGPLLLNFGPMHLNEAAPWNHAFETLPVRPRFYALHHLWKRAGADGGFTWVYHEPWEGASDPGTIRTRIGESLTWFTMDPNRAIVSAFPGFKDVYGRGGKILDHRGGATMQESLQVCMEGPWRIVQLVTWNDYGEGTMIEPTHQFGYTFLEIVQQARRKTIGDTFPFTAEDLRLPARLYALRKAGGAPPSKLKTVSRLLNAGECGEARRHLDQLE